jgi:glycerophosphoryl diester phosphodiesterase
MTNPWLDRRVLSIAHQGGSHEAPSSTIFAIECALANGADGIELDLHPTLDGGIVCLHDDTLERTTNLAGYVHDFDMEDLAEADAAYYFVLDSGEAIVTGAPEEAYIYRGRVAEDHRFGIPTLAEILRDPAPKLFNLDIKEDLGPEGNFEAELGTMIQSTGSTDRTIVASFLQEPLSRFREQYPNVATSASPEEALNFYQGFLSGERPPSVEFEVLQIPASYGGIEYVDPGLISFAHDCGVAVHLWTINDEADMERFVGYGADGLMTDRPSVLRRVLERTESMWLGV